jgi:DNA-binding beta-propeller fold protein YncE
MLTLPGLLVGVACASSPRATGEPAGEPPPAAARNLELPAGVSLAFALDSRAGLGDPVDLVLDPQDRLIVLDQTGPDLVVFGDDGGLVDRWPVSGSSDRAFFRPTHLEASGLALFLMDPTERIILRFDLRGRYQAVALDLDAASLPDAIGFFEPAGLAVDNSGQLYVSDREGDRVLSFDASGRFVTAFGGFGGGVGQLRGPGALATDRAGRVYVADTANGRVSVFDGFGAPLRELPLPPGPGRLQPPAAVAIAVTRGDLVLVADALERLVALTPAGRVRFAMPAPGIRAAAGQPSGRFVLLRRDPVRIEALDLEGS